MIDDYKIIDQISEGAAGVVYLVEKDQARYALKHLKTSESSSLVRFRRESSTLARMNHENLVRVYDVGEFAGAPYVVMELLEGHTLEKEIAAAKKGLQENIAIKIILSLANAFSEIHKNNLVHRDIKPSNVFITFTGTTKLIDFGLVGDIDEIVDETSMLGTPIYCSPEQSRLLKRPVDIRSDLYSLGVLFFELLTGRTPFLGTLSEILRQHSATPAPNVKELKPEISHAAAQIISKILSKDPDDRYQSSSGLIYDLKRIVEINEIILNGGPTKLGEINKVGFATKIKYVERLEEQTRLDSCWQSIQNNLSGLVLVSGLSGSGKSRLCDEFVKRNVPPGTLVLKGKCQVFDKSLPLSAIREAMDSFIENNALLPMEVKKSNEILLRKASEGLEINLSTFSSGLQKLFGIKAGEVEVFHNAQIERDKYFSNIAAFFANLCEHWDSVILQLDDLQWLDQSSIELILKIAETTKNKKFLFLCTARNDKKSQSRVSEFTASAAHFIFDQIEMKSFSVNQAYALVKEFLGATLLDETIVDALYVRSGGNPFVVIDYLRASVDQGILSFKNKQWQLNRTELEKLPLSDSAYGLMFYRLEGLAVDVRTYLQQACVFGTTFNCADIATIANIKDTLLIPILKSAVDAGLIIYRSGTKYQFVHDKITESLMRSTTEDVAKNLADKLANFYYNKKLKTEDEILATARLFQSGNLLLNIEDAARANMAAAHIALSKFAYNEAYGTFQFALQLVRSRRLDKEFEIDIAPHLAKCCNFLGYWEVALQLSSFAIENSRSRSELISNLSMRVWICRCSADFLGAWEYFKVAYNLVCGPYPINLHLKLLKIAQNWCLTLTADFVSSLFPTLWIFKSKQNSEQSLLSNLFLEAFQSLEYQEKRVDYFFLSFKLLRIAQTQRDLRSLSLGYACLAYTYGITGISKALSKLYGEKSLVAAALLNDPATLAKCKKIHITSQYWTGEILDLVGTVQSEKDFFIRNLDPEDYYSLCSNNVISATLAGKNLLALRLLSEVEKDLQRANGGARGRHKLILNMHQNWFNLSLSGQEQESLKIKKIALKESNELRFSSHVSDIMLRWEIHFRRYTNEMDSMADEFVRMAHFRQLKSVNPINLMVKVSFAYLLLEKIVTAEKNSNLEESTSLRQEFIRTCLFADRHLMIPAYRAHLFHVLGRYYRLFGSARLAEYYFNESEQLALVSGALTPLFDVHVDKARDALTNGKPMAAKSHAMIAFDLANENMWTSRIAAVKKEFFDVQVQPGTYANGHKTNAASLTHMQTIQHSNSTLYDATATPHSSSINQARFMEALLNVNSAFTKSFDLELQSRYVLIEIVKLFAAQRGFVFLRSEDGSTLNFLAGKSSDGMDIKAPIGFSNTVVNKVFKTGTATIVAGTDEGEAIGSESAVIHNLRSIMATPLSVKGAVIGVVYVDSSLSRGLFTEADIKFFTTLANYISTAFELSRMALVEMEKSNLLHQLNVQSAIAVEAKKVKVLVDHMQQSVFAVNSSGSIVEPVSQFSQSVLSADIVGENVMTVLYNDILPEAKSLVQSSMVTVFGEDDLQWDLVVDNFPTKLIKSLPNGGSKVLKVQLSPIWSEENLLENILFVVEDITQMELLDKNVKEQSRKTAAVEEILNCNSDQLSGFLKQTNDLLALVITYLDGDYGPQLVDILKEFHTLKGNARLFGLGQLSQQVHESESILVTFIQSPPEEGALRNFLQDELNKITLVKELYEVAFNKIYANRSPQVSNAVEAFALQSLDKVVDSLRTSVSVKEFAKLKMAAQKLTYRSLSSVVAVFQPMVLELSTNQGKKIELVLNQDGLISAENAPILQDCLLHLIRNSIDHGLENPETRLRSGKAETGKIALSCHEGPNGLEITMSDDGAGINVDRIIEKAIENKILTPEKAASSTHASLLNLIFLPNFSTKNKADELSGRGLGMDIVRSNLEQINGQIVVKNTSKDGTTFQIIFHEQVHLKVSSL